MKVRSPIFLALTYILYLRDGPVIFEDGGKERGGGGTDGGVGLGKYKNKSSYKAVGQENVWAGKKPKEHPPAPPPPF